MEVSVFTWKKKNGLKQLNLHWDKETETIYLEINIQLRKRFVWLYWIVGLYKPLSQSSSLLLRNMSKNISRHLDSYENTTFLWDFNITPEDKKLQYFTHNFSLEHLINESTCFKGSPSCKDLIITNRKSYFKNTCVTVTGISDIYKLTEVTLKSQVIKALSSMKT